MASCGVPEHAIARVVGIDPKTLRKHYREELDTGQIKGNMVELAIGFIIGAAFSGLVQSVVNDIIMPIIGLITGGIDFSQMYIQLSGEPAATLDQAREAGATIAYGNFITLVINFLIVAWVLFIVVKAMNRMKRPPPPADIPPSPPTREETLLGEIRDLLAKKS